MENSKINDPSTNQGNLFAGMPPPADAWQDMCRRLDDEMPVAGGLPLPGGIINVSNRMRYSITWLFALLLLLTFWQDDINRLNHSNNSSSNNIGKTPGNTIISQPEVITGNSNTPVDTGQRKNATTTQPTNITKIATANRTNNTRSTITAASKKKHIVPVNSNAQKQSVKPGQSNAITQSAGGQPQLQANTNNTINKPAETTISKSENTPLQPTPKPQPATAKSIEPPTPPADTTRQWQAGLWFKAQLPFSSSQHYFAGPNGSSQSWRILLPGAWISYQYGKHLFDVEVNPFASTVYNPKSFSITTILVNGQTLVTKTEKLNKTFGASLSVGYSYNVNSNWWAGGRLQTTLINNGVASSRFAPANLFNDRTFGPISSADKANIEKIQVKLDAELLYKASYWAAGLRAGVYFSPSVIKGQNISNPLETELFFTWRLWQHIKK